MHLKALRQGESNFNFGREFFPRSLGEFGQGSAWSPQVEVFEREGQLVVRADLPGLTKDDVKVEVMDNAINLSGERKQEHEEKGEGFYRSERSYGSFYRRIPLPEGVNADQANATFRNGVLEITMQAPERQSRSRQLEIKEGGQEQPRAKAAGDNSGGGARDTGKLGISVETLTPPLASRLNLPTGMRGLVVTDVDPAGPAADSGIQEGDVIEEVNRQPVRSVGDLQTAIQRTGTNPALLLVNRRGNSLFLTVRPRQ